MAPWSLLLTPYPKPPPPGMQVSHHPPIGAGHGESDLWSYDLVSAPKTKFLGNSVEVYPIGAWCGPNLCLNPKLQAVNRTLNHKLLGASVEVYPIGACGPGP